LASILLRIFVSISLKIWAWSFLFLCIFTCLHSSLNTCTPELFIFPLKLCDYHALTPIPPCPQPLSATILLMSPWVWPLQLSHVRAIIQYLSFCDWLISLCIMSSRLIDNVACIRISFLIRRWIIMHFMYVTHFVYHSSMYGCVISTFWLLGIILLWAWMHSYLCKSLFSVLEVELLDHTTIQCIVFWGTAILFQEQLL
jgi:hypothetical protein